MLHMAGDVVCSRNYIDARLQRLNIQTKLVRHSLESARFLFTGSAVSRVSALRPGSSHTCSVRLKSARRNPCKPLPGIVYRSL